MHPADPSQPTGPTQAQFPSADLTLCATAASQPVEICHVGEVRHVSAGPSMTDASWKEALDRVNAAWAQHTYEYALTGSPKAKEMLDRVTEIRKRLMAGRSSDGR